MWDSPVVPLAWTAFTLLIGIPAALKAPLKSYGAQSEPDVILRHQASPVQTLLFSNDNRCLVAGDSAGHLVVWNLQGQSKRGVKACKAGLMSLWHYPEHPAYLAATEKSLLVGGAQPGFERSIREDEVPVKLVKWFWSNDMEWQVMVHETGTADVNNKSTGFAFEITHKKRVNDAIAVSPDSKTLVARVDSDTSVFDLNTGRVLRNLDFGQPVPALAFAPDGRLFGAYGFNNYKVDAAYGWFDPTLMTLRRVGRRLPVPVNKLVLSARGDRLAVAGSFGFIRVYDTGGECEIFRFNAQGPIRALALSPDGQTLACSGGEDGSIRLWDLSKRTPRS